MPRALWLSKTLLTNDPAALAERGGERRDMMVVEVENGGGASRAAGDAPDLLDNVAFERDRCCEDESVEIREVHPFARDLSHGNKDELGRAIEGLSGGFAILGRLRTVERKHRHGEVGIIVGEKPFEGADVLAALD